MSVVAAAKVIPRPQVEGREAQAVMPKVTAEQRAEIGAVRLNSGQQPSYNSQVVRSFNLTELQKLADQGGSFTLIVPTKVA